MKVISKRLKTFILKTKKKGVPHQQKRRMGVLSLSSVSFVFETGTIIAWNRLVKTAVNKGTTFTITLPIKLEEQTRPKVQSPA
jgi:hypothetical protein